MNNVIDIEIDGQFLEIGQVSIRIEEVFNRMTHSISPNTFSFPFSVPATPNNRKLLNFIDLAEGLTQIRTFRNAKLYYDGNFDRNLLLYIDSHANGLFDCNLVSGIDNAITNLLETNLRDINFFDYNKFWFPETYRYCIGSFDFDPTTTGLALKINSTTYTQSYTTDHATTVQLLLNQVNADTVSNHCTGRIIAPTQFLFLPGSPSFGTVYVLIKGNNQFDFNPSVIMQDPAYPTTFTALINHLNDVTSGASNAATHMLNITIPNLRQLYEYAFGTFFWRFPMIYNPNFMGEPTLLSIYDYFINTYDVVTGKFLWRVGAGTQQNVNYPDYPCIPQVQLKFVLETVFKNAGLTMDAPFFEEDEFKDLLLESLHFETITYPEEMDFRANQSFDLRKCMPDMTVQELLVGLKKLWGLNFDYDYSNNNVKVYQLKGLIQSDDYIDMTNLVIGSLVKSTISGFEEGIKIGYEFDSSDDWASDRVKDISELNICPSVANQAALPTSGNQIGDARLVEDVNQYFIVDVTTTPDTWTFYSDNFGAIKTLEGKAEIELPIAPMLMINNPGRKTGVSGSAPVLTTFARRTPIVKQEGVSVYHKLTTSTFGGRLFFYRDMDALIDYPFASSDQFLNDGTAHFNETLTLEGEDGVYIKHLKPIYDFYGNAVKYELTLKLPLKIAAMLPTNKKWQIENQRYLVDAKSIEANKNKDFSTVKITMYK